MTSQTPHHTPESTHDKVFKTPGYHNELVQSILSSHPCRTLHGGRRDITVYEKSGWNIYVVKDANGEIILLVDTSHPDQHSEVGLYQEKQYKGRTFIKLHKDYDGFVKEYLSGKLSIEFKMPSKTSE